MTPLAQLEYVRRHFLPFKGRLATLEDVYMTILWPAAVGRPAASVLFARDSDRPKVYFQNRGLDLNKDGSISRMAPTRNDWKYDAFATAEDAEKRRAQLEAMNPGSRYAVVAL